MKLWSKLTLADIFTLFNALLGFLAITYIVDNRLFEASLLIIVCMAMDGLDGMIARYMDTSHKMGAYLDLFADAISFCFAPALLVYTVYYDEALGRAWESPLNAAATAVPMVLVFFGVLRLSRFADKESAEENYNGLPVPILALTIVLLISVFDRGALLVMGIVLLISALLYSNIKYPKLWGFGGVLAGGALIFFSFFGVILGKNSYSLGPIFLFTALVMCGIYITIGPVGYSWKKKQKR
ncbi:MAG: CDP-diacylglycerol--serine O-phosphatidyltransferase [Thermoplasmata archaeon]